MHGILARIHLARSEADEARASAVEAIRLDPEDPDHRALLAQAEGAKGRWAPMLAAAEAGLSLDPEHVDCANLRSYALNKLGRRGEAGDELAAALSRDPEDPFTHANVGWQKLERGDTKGALLSFREALRLDPTNEWARQGIVEAIKARNPVYRQVLRYFFWMSRLSGRTQWIVILGAWFGAQVVKRVARAHPELAPYLWPVLILYLVAVFLTWIAGPLFNLALRLHPFGRHALSEEQIRGANVVGLLLAATLLCVGINFFVESSHPLLAALIFGGMIIPAAGYWTCGPRGRRAVGIFLAVQAVFALGAFAAIASGRIGSVGGGLVGLCLLGLIAAPWFVNYHIARGR